jgi:hypothetical protein
MFSEVVLFAQMSEETITDKIPLTEIKAVREMIDTDDKSQKPKDCNAFMIETNPDGYNSGRTYYLQADSNGACWDVSQKILKSSTFAVEKANSKTSFANAQQRVRKIYKSAIFKNVMALLILTVRRFL